LLFGPKHRSSTLSSLPQLKILTLEPFCLFAYLLSGGFKPMNLLPESFYSAVSKFERATSPLWRRIAALRILIVLEKPARSTAMPMVHDDLAGGSSAHEQ